VKLAKIISVKIVDCNEELQATLRQFRDGLNYVSNFIHENKIYNHKTLQPRVYATLRERFGLKSQMACNCVKMATAKYAARDVRARGSPVLFRKLAMVQDYPRDYRITGPDTISVNSTGKRLQAHFQCGAHQRELLKLAGSWQVKSATLVERRSGAIFLQVTIERDAADQTFLGHDGAVGVDMGINTLAVTTDSNNKTTFYREGRVQHARYKYQQVRQSCQSKGTRSAKKRLRKISGRERRFVTDTNHCVAKSIVATTRSSFASPLLVLEDLTGIRKNPRRSKIGKYQLNTWAFYQLQQFITYKALEHDIPVIFVDPKYTSQACPRCGHVERKNRKKTLHQFQCVACGYESNDDRAASINIRNRGVVPWHIRDARGICQVP